MTSPCAEGELKQPKLFTNPLHMENIVQVIELACERVKLDFLIKYRLVSMLSLLHRKKIVLVFGLACERATLDFFMYNDD